MAWLPGACNTPVLPLNKCVVHGLGAWTFALRRQRLHVRIVSVAPIKSGTSRFLAEANICLGKHRVSIRGSFAVTMAETRRSAKKKTLDHYRASRSIAPVTLTCHLRSKQRATPSATPTPWAMLRRASELPKKRELSIRPLPPLRYGARHRRWLFFQCLTLSERGK